MQLLFLCERNLKNNLMGHPVEKTRFFPAHLWHEERPALADWGERVLLAVLDHVERLGVDGRGDGGGVAVVVDLAVALVIPAAKSQSNPLD